MSFNRQYSMFPSKPINSTMPMVIGRVQYEEPTVPVPVPASASTSASANVESSYPDAIYKTGVVTVIKTHMNVNEITHNNKASIRFISAKHSEPKPRIIKPNYSVEYHYNNPTDITHNNKSSIRFIKSKH